MLTRTKIRNLTHASFYARGLDLYLTDKVIDMEIREKSFVDFISAHVRGSGTKVYNVHIRYDEAKDQMLEEECDCPAFYSYDGLCKHIIAALLKYVDKKEYERTQQTDPEREAAAERERAGEMSSALKAGQDAERQKSKMRTTPVMKQLLDRNTMKKTAPLTQNGIFGKVRIEPTISGGRDGVTVNFRVGAEQMYVLKDIFEFADHMKYAADYEYGKKLRFIHLPEAFEPGSRGLVRFLMNWAKENENAYPSSRYGYRWYNGRPRVREITLSGGPLEAFIMAAGDMPLGGSVERMLPAEEEDWKEIPAPELWNFYEEWEWKYTEGHPARTLKIIGRKDGILLKARQPARYQGEQYDVCFENGRIFLEPRAMMEPVREFQECVEAMKEFGIFIQKEDVPAFCRDILPVLEQFYVCSRENFREEDYNVLPVSFEIYLDAPQYNIVTCRVIAVYGDHKYNIYEEKADSSQRDLVREIAVGQAVAAYCDAYDSRSAAMAIADNEEKIYELLTEGIPKLQELGEVYISDALKKVKVAQSPHVTVGISLSGELLQLTVSSEDMSREELLEILSRYDRRKKYYRLKNGDFVNVAGEGLESLIELKNGLGLTDRQLRKEKIDLPKYRAFFLDSELKADASLITAKDKAFRGLIRHMRTVEDNDFEVPDSLSGVLREYQKQGFLWLKTLRYNGFGGILADDMGLGKTLQVLTFLKSEFQEAGPQENRKCLIVTPASLVYNWYNEVQRFAPDLPVTMAVGTLTQRHDIIRNMGLQEILITSYDLLKRDIDCYSDIEFFCQVIDEAQFIKNHNTQAAKAVKDIRAGCKFALTGTPVENRLSELWSIFDYLMPGFLYSYERFREELESPIVQMQDEAAMGRLQKMIRPFVLRRLKKDVLRELPDKLEEDVYAVLEGEQRKLYDAHVKRLSLMLGKQTDEEFRNSRIQILSELTKLRQLCCDPALLYEGFQENSCKEEMCLDMVRNAISGGHKILLFSQFTTMLEILCGRFREEHITYYTLTGSTSKEKRKELVERFQQDDTNVFCISLKAGGTGLNLTAADIVIHYDPWWNLAVQNQATDRAHRIGQKNTVTVYKLITKGTIEENILKLQEKKRELADQLLSGENAGSGSFTKEELLEIIGTAGY